jgi:hypothetical protein
MHDLRITKGARKMKTIKRNVEEEYFESKERYIIACMEIFAKVTIKQGSIVPFDIFYGDGSRFPQLTRDGVLAVYESFIELWKEAELIS